MAGETLTWGEAAKQFQDRHGAIHHAPATARMFRNVLGAYGKFLSSVGVVGLCEVSRDRVELYQRRRLEAGASRATVNADLRHLRAFLRWAADHGYIPSDPTAKVKFIRETRRIGHRYVTPDEIKRALEAMTALKWDIYADAALTVANTGLRLGELLHLLTIDLDIPGKRLYVRNRDGFQTKDREDRIIALNSKALEALQRRVLAAGGPEMPLFPRSFKACQRALQYISKNYNLPRLNWYALRHSFATHAAEVLSEAQLAYMMGHQDPSTTRKFYTHLEQMRLIAPPAIG